MLWLQVRSAAEEYHAEFAAKEATIATLTAEAESARSHMQAEIDKLRSDMEVSTGSTFTQVTVQPMLKVMMALQANHEL